MTTKKFDIIEQFTKEFPTGKNKYYKCKCECGNIFESAKNNVDTGKTLNCNKGSCHKHVLFMIGKKFGRLTVKSHKSRTEGYLCECECGNTTTARSYDLKSGSHHSCGCLARYQLANRNYKGYGISALNSIFRNYKRSANKRGYVFEISKPQFEQLIKDKCYYCGAVGSMVWKSDKKIIVEDDYPYNGVDRVNNSIGYTKSNCVSCCSICNNSKSTLSVDTWREWISRVYTNLVIPKRSS